MSIHWWMCKQNVYMQTTEYPLSHEGEVGTDTYNNMAELLKTC